MLWLGPLASVWKTGSNPLLPFSRRALRVQVEQILGLYPLQEFGSALNALNAIVADIRVVCGTVLDARKVPSKVWQCVQLPALADSAARMTAGAKA